MTTPMCEAAAGGDKGRPTGGSLGQNKKKLQAAVYHYGLLWSTQYIQKKGRLVFIAFRALLLLNWLWRRGAGDKGIGKDPPFGYKHTLLGFKRWLS